MQPKEVIQVGRIENKCIVCIEERFPIMHTSSLKIKKKSGSSAMNIPYDPLSLP